MELYTVVSFAITYTSRMAFILFMGREPPTGTRKLYGFEITFQKVKLFKVVSVDTSYGGSMAFFSFMGGEPPYKREPESCTV